MDGILIVNKPKWYTSFDVIAKIRNSLKTKKVGHTGTLDPMATGVLVVCVGKATSLVNVLTSEDKIYKTTIKLGIETDTADLTGRITKYLKDGKIYENNQIYNDDLTKKNIKYISEIANINYNNNLEFTRDFKLSLNIEKIQEVLKSFVGTQEQTPPIYSSIKIDGKKLYEYAREQRKVNIPSRKIEIFDIYDIDYNGNDEITYTVHCSKGTYIRTLNEDISKKLGLIGTTMALERLKIGNFSLDYAVDIEDISEDKMIKIEDLYNDKIILDSSKEKRLINGMDIEVINSDGIYNIYIDEKYIGLGKVKDNILKRFIII